MRVHSRPAKNRARPGCPCPAPRHPLTPQRDGLGADLAATGRCSMNRSAAPERVLLIEDDPWVQSLLAELLEDEGYVISRALTGREGLRMSEQLKPALIVLDL